MYAELYHRDNCLKLHQRESIAIYKVKNRLEIKWDIKNITVYFAHDLLVEGVHILLI